MPRFYFNVFHTREQLDWEGEELPDRHAAWAEATATAGEILRDLDGSLKAGQEWRLEVLDEFRATLYVLHINAEKVK
jgi:hypothetical protein